jgi:uncharacterized coiled-coil DUF342 family protein
LLDQFIAVRRERDDLIARIQQLEAECHELQSVRDRMALEVQDARKNTRDREKEDKIRSKVDELLAKLEGF